MRCSLFLQENKKLSELCTLGVGGIAKFYFKACSEDDFKKIFSFCLENKLPYFVLGKGSNLLFSSKGFNGVVIENGIDFCEMNLPKIKVGAGFSFSKLGKLSASVGFSGLEFASSIPASIGGAIYLNASAQGMQTFDCLEGVEYLTEFGEKKFFNKKELTFGYRNTCFKDMKGAILAAEFLFKEDISTLERQKEMINYRLKTQPLKYKSAGCFFRNPVGFSAGRLIDEAGLKGKRIGGAEISSLHGNFILNVDNATSEDVLELSKLVKDEVFRRFNVKLEEEVQYVEV